MTGKGDKKRPMQISNEQFEKNFEAIFGNKKEVKDADKVKSKPEDKK
tara:strand:- start:1377 stop:1517 length:141 start_codon:yes stop_codon:yes gene_type:complete